MIDNSMAIPKITVLGKSPFDPIWTEQEHVDQCSELMNVLQGHIEVRTRDYSVSGVEGDTIYIPAGMPHRDLFAFDSAFEVYLVQFNWSDENKLLSNLNPVQMAKISRPTKKRITAEFHQLYQDFLTGLPLSRDIVNLQLLKIIYRIMQDVTAADVQTPENRDANSIRRMQIMSKAKRYIEDKNQCPIALEDIATQLNISPYYLSHVFSQESGFTLSHYLREVRMEKAAKLLKDQQMKISDIAMAVGFSDSIYFRKVFKAYFGVSPKTYREKHHYQP